jgi:hypothetical protein
MGGTGRTAQPRDPSAEKQDMPSDAPTTALNSDIAVGEFVCTLGDLVAVQGVGLVAESDDGDGGGGGGEEDEAASAASEGPRRHGLQGSFGSVHAVGRWERIDYVGGRRQR